MDNIVPDFRLRIHLVDHPAEGTIRQRIHPKFHVQAGTHLSHIGFVHVNPHLQPGRVQNGDQIHHLKSRHHHFSFLRRDLTDHAGNGAADDGIGETNPGRFQCRLGGGHGIRGLLADHGKFLLQTAQRGLSGAESGGRRLGVLHRFIQHAARLQILINQCFAAATHGPGIRGFGAGRLHLRAGLVYLQGIGSADARQLRAGFLQTGLGFRQLRLLFPIVYFRDNLPFPYPIAYFDIQPADKP